MTVHSLANFLPSKTQKAAADKENDSMVNVVIDENNYLTLGDLQKVEPPMTIAENRSSPRHASRSPEKKAIRSSSKSLGRRKTTSPQRQRSGNRYKSVRNEANAAQDCPDSTYNDLRS